jgi:hypothetical protein
MIKFKMTGLDELQKKLETLQRRAQSLNGPVPFEDLFPPEFMRRYTNFKSIEEMLVGFGAPITSTEEFERIPDAEWDVYVSAKTRFKSWDEMQFQAGQEYAERRLNFDNL